MKEVKRVFFYIRHDGYTEVEWVMPLLHYYKRRGVEITVLLPIKANNSRQKLLLGWLESYSDHIIYGYELFDTHWFLRFKYYLKYKRKNRIVDMLGKALLLLIRRLTSIAVFSPYLNRPFTKELRRFLDRFDIVYCPEGSFPRNSSNELANLIQVCCQILDKPMVGYLKSAFSDIRDLAMSNYGLDWLLVLSDVDKAMCEKTGLRATVLGAQRFRASWVREVSSYFSGLEVCSDLKKRLSDKAVVLALLKNRTGLVQKNLSVEDHFEYRKKMFQALVNAGFHLLIKPHPSDNSLPINDVMRLLPDDSYTVSEIPAQYLASISLCCVCEMPSNSLMDSIAADKKAYWPYLQLANRGRNLDDEDVIKLYSSSGFPKKFARFVEIDIPSLSDAFELERDIREEFDQLTNLHIDVDHAMRTCENAVLRYVEK